MNTLKTPTAGSDQELVMSFGGTFFSSLTVRSPSYETVLDDLDALIKYRRSQKFYLNTHESIHVRNLGIIVKKS